MKKYLLCWSHGEYDDHVSTPIMIVNDRATAELIQEAIENKDPMYFKYMDAYKISDAEEVYIDIDELPFVEI